MEHMQSLVYVTLKRGSVLPAVSGTYSWYVMVIECLHKLLQDGECNPIEYPLSCYVLADL